MATCSRARIGLDLPVTGTPISDSSPTRFRQVSYLTVKGPLMNIKLNVEGMTCDGCRAAVERVLKAQPGVNTVVVDLKNGEAQVSTDNADANALAAAVTNAGYEASVQN